MTLFTPFQLGPLALKNRIAMAPLTRQMADADGTPTAEMAAYYARRARGGLGLIISEGTYPCGTLGAAAYLSQPGIASPGHVAGWRLTTQAVHALGVPILCQLMHGGRVTDPRCLGPGESPVSASDTQSSGWVLYTDSDDEKHLRGVTGGWPKMTFPPARALAEAEIHQIADDFAAAAGRAVQAGFDGVEIHAANGYLLYQFIHPKTNLRTDAWGGDAARNVAFAKLVCARVRDAIGPDKAITLRLSQNGVDDFGGTWPGGVAYARAVGAALADCAADALHWSSFGWSDSGDPADPTPMPTALRRASGKPVIVNGGIADGPTAEAVFEAEAGDLVAVGRPLFAHPDWPHIVRSGLPYDWAPFDRRDVVAPQLDHGLAYPGPHRVPDWPADPAARRAPGWMAD